MSLYSEIKDAGVPLSNHYSDLYFESNSKALAILDKFPEKKKISSSFTHQVNGNRWVEVPFAYLPYWEKKCENG